MPLWDKASTNYLIGESGMKPGIYSKELGKIDN
jgi:hypothetical protein